MPAQSLIEFKELLDMPALGIILGQRGDLRELGGAQEALVVIVLGAKAVALNVFVIKGFGLVLEVVRPDGRGVAGPVLGELGGGNSAPALDAVGEGWLGAEQVKDVLLAHTGEEFLDIVFLVRED